MIVDDDFDFLLMILLSNKDHESIKEYEMMVDLKIVDGSLSAC